MIATALAAVAVAALVLAVLGWKKAGAAEREREKSSRREHARYGALVDQVSDGIAWCDPAGRLTSVNPVFCRMLGFERSDLMGRRLDELIAPTDRNAWTSRSDGSGTFWRGGMQRKDGATRDVEIATALLPDGHMQAVVRDNTERQRSDHALEQSLSLLRATLEATGDGLLVVDITGRIVSYNRKFVEMWRIPEAIMATASDERALEFTRSQLRDPDGFLARVHALYDHPEVESTDLIEFRDGRIFERYSKPQRIGDLSVGRVWSFRDVTMARALEEQLRQAQKMEAVGQLTGGIAHDFNNILTVILANAQLIANSLLPDQDEMLGDLSELQAAARRGTALITRLLGFSRHAMLSLQPVDLGALMQDLSTTLRRLLPENIEIRLTAGEKVPPVQADAGAVEQIVLNLATNARDAMPRGGELHIETAHVPPREREFGGTNRGVVRVVVSDTGVGMDEATRARMFEPFFTTKAPGEGSGLGMAIVYGLAKQHHGTVVVTSEPGHGTTVAVDFPVPDFDLELPQPAAALTDIRGGTETILLAEDQEPIRRAAKRVLERFGYSVMLAADGAEALDMYLANEARIDLVITDIVMPRMSGLQLYEELRRAGKTVRFLFTSGYTGRTVLEQGGLNPALPFLNKPWTLQELLQMVRDLLDRGPKG